MKGIVFTEFLEMVETAYGLETVDLIIESSDLKSKGIYTSIGTYDFNEMLSLITNLSEEVSIPVDDLLYQFGKYFFYSLTDAHPKIFKQYNSPIKFLASIENHIHVHVAKIYPEAELPTFEVVNDSIKNITMIYKSERALYRFAHGLMEKTLEYYKIDGTVTYEKLNEKGTEVKFTILKNE